MNLGCRATGPGWSCVYRSEDLGSRMWLADVTMIQFHSGAHLHHYYFAIELADDQIDFEARNYVGAGYV